MLHKSLSVIVIIEPKFKADFMENTLSKYKPIADAIAMLMDPYAEVVIHDIIKDIIVHIANPYSKRRAGDLSYLGLDGDEPDFGLDRNVLGPYEKAGEEGQRIRSITAVLRNDEAQPIGILCINLDFSPLETAFESAFEGLNRLIRPAEIEARPEIIFHEEWRELIKLEIRAFRLEKGLTQDSMNAKDRRELLRRLDQKRLFYARKSVEQVAGYLMISRATAYKDLNEIRKGNDSLF
jgi:predicted transcriptional regulator YheO